MGRWYRRVPLQASVLDGSSAQVGERSPGLHSRRLNFEPKKEPPGCTKRSRCFRRASVIATRGGGIRL